MVAVFTSVRELVTWSVGPKEDEITPQMPQCSLSITHCIGSFISMLHKEADAGKRTSEHWPKGTLRLDQSLCL